MAVGIAEKTVGRPAEGATERPANAGANGYARMFLLEHSEYATELAR